LPSKASRRLRTAFAAWGEAFQARLGAFLALPEEVLAEVEACHLVWLIFGVKYRLAWTRPLFHEFSV